MFAHVDNGWALFFFKIEEFSRERIMYGDCAHGRNQTATKVAGNWLKQTTMFDL